MDEEPDEALATLIDQAKQSSPIQELKCKLCPKTFTGVNMLIATLLHLKTEHDGFFESQQNSISSSSEFQPGQLLGNENMDVSSSNMDSTGELAASIKYTTQADTTFKETVTTYDNKETQTECETSCVATETGLTEPLPVPDPMKMFLCISDKLGTCQPYHCVICGTYKSNLRTAVIHLVQKHNVPLRRPGLQNKPENLSPVCSQRIGKDRQTARKSIHLPTEKVVTETRQDSSTSSLHSEKLASTIAKLHKPSKPATPLVSPHLMPNKRSVRRAVSADIVTSKSDLLSKAANPTLNLPRKKTPVKSRENSTSSFHLSTKKKREAFKESIKENSRKNKKLIATKRRCLTNKTFKKKSLSVRQTSSPPSDESFTEGKTAKCTDLWKNLAYNSTKDRNAKPETDCDTTDSENNFNTFRPGSSKPSPFTEVTTDEVQPTSKVTRTQSAPDVSREYLVSNRKVRNTARKSTRPNKPHNLPLDNQGQSDMGLEKFTTFEKSPLKPDRLSSSNICSRSIDSEQESSSSSLPTWSTPSASSSSTAVSTIKKRPTSRKSIRSTT